ncbi:DUF3817 domain-containing protein [Leucobacter sp. GX24907]
MSPRVLFRTFAIAEVITWAGLIAALILRGTGVTEAAVAPAGGVHGFVFLAYCGVTVFVWVNQRWRPAVGLIGLASSVVPFATLPFEIVADRRGLLSGGWRLAPGGNQPHGLLERLQAQILRRPLAALLVFVVAVTVVFLVLLWLGPPVPRS